MEVTYDAMKKRVAKLEAENAGLSANQCLHNIHGDEAGNPYCPRIAELKAALDFYACIDHYQTHNAVAPNVVQTDRGAKARAALEGEKDD